MSWSLKIENVAGIRCGHATIEHGINAVRASNWEGKSSFIRAIKTAMGSVEPLTNGEQSGSVRLETPELVASVELERNGQQVASQGSPLLTDPYDRRRAELFAFLDDVNEIRRAVRFGDPLESFLTEPLDLADIEGRINRLQQERDEIQRELDRAESAADRVTVLCKEIDHLESDLEELQREREALDQGTPDRAAVQELRDDISDAKSEHAQVVDLIERTSNDCDRIRSQLASKYEVVESLFIPDLSDLEDEISDLEPELRSLEQELDLLESIYAVNSRILEEDRLELVGMVNHDLVDDQLDCWICGDRTTRATVESKLAELCDMMDHRQESISDLRKRVKELEDQRSERDQMRRQERDLQTDIRQLEDTLADREDTLNSASERRTFLENRIEELSSRVDAVDDERTELESEIKYIERQLADRREVITDLESCSDRRDHLAEKQQQIEQELERVRGQRDRIKDETRAAFDATIADVVPLFETSFETARLTSQFELVVARDGREVSINALSEGEVELLGLVTALAGYEAYDVRDVLPMILLDGLGGLADQNLRHLVSYLETRTDYLVITAYPENEGIGDWEIDPREWTVVSDGMKASG